MSDYIIFYRPKIKIIRQITIDKLLPGHLIQFFHKNDFRIGMVISPNFKKKLHILSLKEIPYDEFRKIAYDRYEPSQNRDKNVSAKNLYEEFKLTIKDFDAFRTYKLEDVNRVALIEIMQDLPFQKEDIPL